MKRFLQFLSFSLRFVAAILSSAALSCLLCKSTKQEQGIAAEIVHVVIAGNSVEIPRNLLNGQVTILDVFCVLFLCLILKFSFYFNVMIL